MDKVWLERVWEDNIVLSAICSWARVVMDQVCHLVLSELNMRRWSEESQT